MKRVTVATLSGLLFGFVCFGFASSGPGALAWPVAVQIITSRTLIGLAIGISALSFGHWALHGLILGLLFSLPLAFSGLMAPDELEFSKAGMWVGTVVLGIACPAIRPDIDRCRGALLRQACPAKGGPANGLRFERIVIILRAMWRGVGFALHL